MSWFHKIALNSIKCEKTATTICMLSSTQKCQQCTNLVEKNW